MGDRSTIEWCDATWGPVRGCSRVSPGCQSCFAERIAARFSGPGMPYEGLARRGKNGPRWTGEVRLVEEHLTDPLKWRRRPRRIFVNSMSDLFHEKLRWDEIDRVFGVMSACEYFGDAQGNAFPGHVFQVLTKRADRMREYLSDPDRPRAWARWAVHYAGGRDPDGLSDQIELRKGPPPHIWIGVSVEDQARADERIPELLATPAAVRFLSCEPLLGPLDLTHLDADAASHKEFCQINALTGRHTDMGRPCHWVARIDWVIAGAESGPGARPMSEEWVRSLRNQCAGADIPFFFKQKLDERGRKVGLPLLDGQRHAAFPEVR